MSDPEAETLEKPKSHVLEQVPPHLLMQILPHVADLLEKACDYSGGRFTPSDVVQACSGQVPSRIWQLWVVFDPSADAETFGERVLAITVTSLNLYPSGLKVGEIILIAGHGQSDEWLPYAEDLKLWAMDNACDRMQFIGRSGFRRKLGSDWRPAATMYEFDLRAENGRVIQRH